MLCIGRRLKSEDVGTKFYVCLPILDNQRVLRCGGCRFAGYDKFAWDGAVSRLHPELPIGVLITKGKMLALNAVDHSLANMLRSDDVRHQRLIRIRNQKIGARQLKSPLVSQEIDELIDRAWSIRLRIGIEILAKHRDGLAIEGKLDIGITARSTGTELVGTAEQQLAGTGELDFWISEVITSMSVSKEREMDFWLAI